jgi:hypothetical protein
VTRGTWPFDGPASGYEHGATARFDEEVYVTTSVRRAALDNWLARASQLIEEQAGDEDHAGGDAAAERPSATEKPTRLNTLRGNRWDGESVPEAIAGMWRGWDDDSEGVVA